MWCMNMTLSYCIANKIARSENHIGTRHWTYLLENVVAEKKNNNNKNETKIKSQEQEKKWDENERKSIAQI